MNTRKTVKAIFAITATLVALVLWIRSGMLLADVVAGLMILGSLLWAANWYIDFALNGYK